MNPIEKRQVRAALYRDRASEAAVLAAASALGNVREKHARAAARWAELAEQDEREGANAPLARTTITFAPVD